MIGAIFEILLLLLVSCLIGVAFTYRFWKAKYSRLAAELSEAMSLISELEAQLLNSKEKQKAMEGEVADAEAKSKELSSQLDSIQKEVAALEDKVKTEQKAAKELNQEIEALKTENKALEAKAKAAKPKPAVDKTETKKLGQEIELLAEQLDEKEREIEVLSRELSVHKISYYKQINGRRYKAITLKMADESIEGQGDGRISKEDAEKIFDTISDGKAYTQVEKDTMRFLRDNYKWTEGADELFRRKVRSWAAKGHELN